MKRIKLIPALFCMLIIFSSCGYSAPITVITAPPSETASAAPPPPSASPSPSELPSPPPSALPSPPPAATPDPLDEYISKMSDRELIGQMVMIGFDGTSDMDSGRRKLMNDYRIGGVFLFGWNTDTFAQTAKLIDKINSRNGGHIPLFIGIDIEGSVRRFTYDHWRPSLKSAKRLGQLKDPELVYKQYFQIGTRLKEIGFNIDFAPVLDISHNPASTFLNNRMFGSNPEKVSALIRRAINGLHDSGIASLGKHFPGLCDSSADPHNVLPVIDLTREQIENYSLIPFKAAIDEGVDAMMVTHIMYPDIDRKYITSASPEFIGAILRGSMGFEGVVFSDDLRMRGFTKKYPVGKGAVMFILAGGDVALIGKYPKMQKDVCDSIYDALQDGTLTRERLEQSVKRILRLKQAYCGFTPQ